MTRKAKHSLVHEHSVLWLWPMAAALEFEKDGLEDIEVRNQAAWVRRGRRPRRLAADLQQRCSARL
jgi:hypothetical protein